jgi:hypothetical protein
MGVRVVPAATPLAPDVRASLKVLGAMPDVRITPTAYDSGARDAAPFDSVPGAGFDTEPGAAAIVPPPGRITGAGALLAIDPGQNNAFRAINDAWAHGATVQFAPGASPKYLIAGLSPADQERLVNSLALVAERTDTAGTPITKPRIGLFQPWSGSMDEGWTRWLLERYGFEFMLLHPEDLKSPLTGRVDVLVLADDARVPLDPSIAAGRGGRPGGPGQGGRGASTGSGQAGRGGRAVRPEYAATLNVDDIHGLEQFVRAGGTILCLNNASQFAIQQFKLPVSNVVAGLRPEEFFLRGTIVAIQPDQTHQVMAGMPEHAAVFADSSPVFETEDGFRGTVLARYQDAGSPLLSGYLIGESHMNGKAAAVDAQLDAGHVILLGFRPEWRDQSFGTFKVVFNALLFAGR